MKTKPSYYDLLNISPQSSDEEVKRAYHKLAKRFHPDTYAGSRVKAQQYFRIINEAYAALKTQDKRNAYSKMLGLSAENDNRGVFARMFGKKD